jgi:hypothetical protein
MFTETAGDCEVRIHRVHQRHLVRWLRETMTRSPTWVFKLGARRPKDARITRLLRIATSPASRDGRATVQQRPFFAWPGGQNPGPGAGTTTTAGAGVTTATPGV